jgi:hypothetical protein
MLLMSFGCGLFYSFAQNVGPSYGFLPSLEAAYHGGAKKGSLKIYVRSAWSLS